ncbi:MAG: hypothetical protein IVW51_13770 [Thermaceae bacterium]|nr:hypothetical protein [Thermaceae bacterium]
MQRNWKFLLGTVGLLALAGCTGLSTTTPTSTPVSVVGTVSGNSSLLTLGGQPVDLSGASVSVDGQAGSVSDVVAGVEISGDGSEEGGKLKMKRVDVRWRARGTVDAVDTTASTVDVVGLRANVSQVTLLFKRNTDGSTTAITLADIKPGDYVWVAGLPLANDSILATRLEVRTATDPTLTYLGVLARSLDSTAKTFSYGLKTYSVDYSKGTVQGTLASDVFVRVKGTRAGSVIQAQTINAPGQNNQSGQHNDIEGLVSNLDTTAQTFSVQGYTVNYAKAQVQGTLANNVRVEVKGTVTGTNMVEASFVEVQSNNDGKNEGDKGSRSKLEGAIANFNATAKTLSINGISVSVTPTTLYYSRQTTLTADTFWGSDRSGLMAQAKGTVSNGTLVADKIELR